jgi:two-component system cell cycle sensor histidine kinase/response regulator CckA
MEPTEQSQDSRVSGVGRAILVIDDDELLLDLTNEFLSDAGYQVYPARTGEEALELFSNNSKEIGLVITDMGLPGIGGDEVVMKIREINPSTKCIAMSGFGGEDMLRQVKRVDFDTFIPKPFDRDLLLKAVGAVVPPPK